MPINTADISIIVVPSISLYQGHLFPQIIRDMNTIFFMKNIKGDKIDIYYVCPECHFWKFLQFSPPNNLIHCHDYVGSCCHLASVHMARGQSDSFPEINYEKETSKQKVILILGLSVESYKHGSNWQLDFPLCG